MTRLGIGLDDVPTTIGWDGLWCFVENLPPDSALARVSDPKMWVWTQPMMAAVILADIYDEVQQLIYMYAKRNSKHSPSKPRPYPRPWKPDEGKRFGRGAIEIRDFDSWYYNNEGGE